MLAVVGLRQSSVSLNVPTLEVHIVKKKKRRKKRRKRRKTVRQLVFSRGALVCAIVVNTARAALIPIHLARLVTVASQDQSVAPLRLRIHNTCDTLATHGSCYPGPCVPQKRKGPVSSNDTVMPSLGFLKKKRTKDSSQGAEGPTSPTVGSPPITPSSTKTSETIFTDPDTLQRSQTQQSHNTPASPQVASPTLTTSPTTSTHQTNGQAMGTSVQPSIANLLNQPAQGTAHDSAYASANFGSQQAVPQINAPSQKPTVNPLRETKGKYTLQDFVINRTLGTGSFGRVHLVQSKHNQRFYAVKVLKKAQVVKMKQIEHTNDERKMLQRCRHPFLITLWGTWQDSKNLYMVMDFIEGGELFSLLRKSQVSLMFVKIDVVVQS